MLLFDSRHKIMLGEINPEKRCCQYLFCQSFGKHRAQCAESAKPRIPEERLAEPQEGLRQSQHAHLRHHPQALCDNYEDLFRWSAMHALEAHWKPSKICTHYLLVHVLYGDCLTGATPGPFEVTAVEVVSYAQLCHIADWSCYSDDKDVTECKRIQDEGGLGQATMLFKFLPPLAYMASSGISSQSEGTSTPQVATMQQMEEAVKKRINGAPLLGMPSLM
ncbi:hypothetical protein V8D89_003429 [Ganoderma adspersum]